MPSTAIREMGSASELPKESARAALREHGVAVKLVTGDNAVVARGPVSRSTSRRSAASSTAWTTPRSASS
jgi:hypothetical protein